MSKTVLITGASSGIGLAISTKCLILGYTVIGLGRDFSRCPEHVNFQRYELDFANLDELPARLQQINERHRFIDALICCAGGGRFGSLEEFSYAQIRQLMDVNFTSQAYVVRAFITGMKKHGAGNIIFIGSDAALSGTKKGTIYCASKFALRGLSQALREECARSGIAVSIIHPGMVNSPFYDKLSFAPGADPSNYVLPEDVAESVALVLAMRPGSVVDEIVLTPQKKVIRFKED